MKYIVFLLILFVADFDIVTTSVNADETEIISSTAKAVHSPNGIVYVESNVVLDKETEDSFNERRMVEKRWPSEHPLLKSKLYEVQKVISGDTIILEDGRIFHLAGVKCPRESDPEFNSSFSRDCHISSIIVRKYAKLSKTYLERLLKGKKVTFTKDSIGKDGVLIGYLWTVDFSLMNNPELKGFIKGPFYSSVNEAIITSGWGIADPSLNHDFSKKYIELQKLAQKAKVGLWE